MKKRKKVLRAAAAGILTASMMSGMLSPIAEVRAEGIAEESSLAESLLAMSDQYPEGGFAFDNPQINVTEGGKTELTILRKGNRDTEAKVSLRAVDVSALYGKDYTVTVKDGAFLTKTLEGTTDGETLTDALNDAQDEAEISNAEEAESDRAETETDETADNIETENDDAQPDTAETDETKAEDTQAENAETDEAEADDTQADVRNEILTDGEAGEAKLNEEKDVQKEFRALEGQSSLNAARDAYFGEETEVVSWTETEATDEEYEAMRDMVQQGDEQMEEFAESIDGVRYDFTFKPGEYKKVITVETMDDEISESEEQVMFLLFGAENAVLADAPSAYVNITDNEEKEESVFAVADSDIYVERGSKYAEVTVTRTKGIERIAGVTVGTSADTTQPGTDYSSYQEDIIFPQGSAQQTVKIPLAQNSETTGEVTFYVGLKGKGSQVDEALSAARVHITDPEQVQVKARAANSTDSSRESFSVNQSVSAYNKNGASMTLNQRFELSTAGSVTINYNLDAMGGCSWTTKDGCDKVSHHSDQMWVQFSTGGVSQAVTAPGSVSGQSVTLDISKVEAAKVSNASIYVKVKGTAGNDKAKVTVTSVVVNYPGYNFEIYNSNDSNAQANPKAYYQERQYYAETPLSGKNYANGKAMWLGSSWFQDNGGRRPTDKTCYKPQTVNTSQEFNQNATNSAGITADGESVEFKGLAIRKGNLETLIEGSQNGTFTFDKNFINKYKKYMSNNNTFALYPVFEPKSSSVYLAESEGDTYEWRQGSGEILECTSMDTVMVQALSNDSNRGIESVNAANVLKDGKIQQLDKSFTASLEYQMKNMQSTSVSTDKETVSTSGNYVLGQPMDDLVNVLPGGGESALIAPRTPLLVYASTSTYQVQVKARKDGANLDQVPYIDEDGNLGLRYKGGVVSESDGEQYAGDPGKPMDIPNLAKGENIKINSLIIPDEEGKALYKTRWAEMTGDVNDDGRIDDEELNALGSYGLLGSTTSNTLVFNVRRPDTLLTYDFQTIETDTTGILQGTVKIKMEEIFSGKTSEDPLPNATVTADDQTAVTGQNKDKGPGNADARTDGYYYMERWGWEISDYLNVNVMYNGNTYTFTQNPNVAKDVTLPGNYPIFVQKDSAKVSIKEEDGSLTSVNYLDMSNGDHDYVLEMKAVSEEGSVRPDKAILRFYTADGAVSSTVLTVKQTPQTVTGPDGEETTVKNTGIFRFEFNPKDLGLEAGMTMTVQFVDQNGFSYYEQPTGISLKRALGTMSFINSFSFSSGAAGILGALNSFFDFGWSGDFDSGDNVLTGEEVLEEYTNAEGQTVQETETVKAITFGFDLSKDRVLNNDVTKELTGVTARAQQMGKAEQKLAEEKKKLKDLEKKKDTTAKDLAKQQEKIDDAQKKADEAKKTYDETVKENDEKKKGSTTLAFNASLETSFSLVIHLRYDDQVQDWYYQDMVVSAAVAANASTRITYATPVGIDLILTIDVGIGSDENGNPVESVMSVSSRKDRRYYLTAESSEDENGNQKIDIFDSDMDDADRQFDFFGAFHVTPRLGLTGEVGISLISTTVGADVSALFDLLYYTDPTLADSQVLKINGGIFVKIFSFKSRWDLGTSEIDLGGGDAKARTMAVANALSMDSQLYSPVESMELDEREYLENRSGWGQVPAAANALSRARTAFNEQVLMTGVYQYPDVQFTDLGDGNVLAVYLDAVPERNSVNSTALYYTVYSGGTWAEPQIIENDGTLDDSPSVADLGNRGVMVAWSTADREFDEDADAIDVLESRNIHTALFDKDRLTFGEVKEATKTTGTVNENGTIEGDLTGDVQPSITYYQADGQERMLLYYSKNEYERTESENGVLGDALNPYSVMAYMYYDFDNDCWRQTYTEEEKEAIMSGGIMTEEQFASYEKQWYGQNFLATAPAVSVEEQLDEGGFWTADPTVTELGEDAQRVAPTVVDSDAVTYNGLGLITYTLDADSNLETSSDRDVYMQIYDYKDNTFTHPIMITSDTVEDSNVKLTRDEDETYLTWISDSKIRMLDVSAMIGGNHYIKGETSDGQEYYYIDKSRDGGYTPPYEIAAYEDGQEAMESGLADAGRGITSYDIQADGSQAYILWTESSSSLREDVDSQSAEATDGSAYETTTQIYGSRLDTNTGTWTSRVQITDTPNANYKDLDFSIRNDGSLMIMAQKNGNQVIEAGDNEGYETTLQDENATSLVSMTYMPEADPQITDLAMDNPEEGETVRGSVDIANSGFDAAEGLTLRVKDESGNVLLEEKDITLGSGENSGYGFEYTLPETKDGSAQGTKVKEMKSHGCSSAVSAFCANAGRASRHAKIAVMKSFMINSPARTVKIVSGADQNTLVELEIPELAPGERTEVTKTIDISDDMFVKGEDAYGNKTETLALQAVTGDTTLESQIVRTTPADIWERFKSIESASIEDISIKSGEVAILDDLVDIQSDQFKYDEYTTFKNYGMTVQWYTDDPETAEVTSDNLLLGLKEGTTVLHGIVMPATYQTEFSDGADSYDRVPGLTLTSDMFREIEAKVTIAKGKTEPEGDPGSQKPGTGTGSGTGSDDSPLPDQDIIQTGDTTQIAVWVILLILSSGCVAAEEIIRRKKR